MAFKVTSLGSVVKDFKKSLSQILGTASGGQVKWELKGHGNALLNSDVDESVISEGVRDVKDANWLGNTKGKKVRYGFAIVDSTGSLSDELKYFLDIPPQALMQKEIFSNNISATRNGVLVETEGVVFKDIVIQGTTGISPGPRGKSNVGSIAGLDFSNLSGSTPDFTAPPQGPKGVDSKTGRSLDSANSNLSGYSEFIYLRQFFLKYAKDKVLSNGDRFLIFINEKDNQSLIVEPLEFVMTRNAKRPLEYNYRIVLKCIGSFNNLLEGLKESGADISLLDQVANVASNIQTAISIGRAVINQSSRTIQRVAETVDQTFNGPLRQVQYAMEDLADGTSTILSLPGILLNNTNNALLNTRDSLSDVGNSFSSSSQTSTSGDVTAAQSYTREQANIEAIENDARIPMSRSFIEDLKNTTNELHNDLADSFNLGSAGFDALDNRTPTQQASPIKTPTDDEFILLGTLKDIAAALDKALATNGMFQSDVEEYYSLAESQFNNIVDLQVPNTVREITIQKLDSLERISQRELGDANRWLELVVLNNLIPPYLDEKKSDRVLQYGDIILIPVT